MSHIINRYTMNDVQNIINTIKKSMDTSSPVVISASLFSLGVLQGIKSHKKQVQAWANMLEDELQDYPWAISTYNYDFPKTRNFKRNENPSQLGPVSKYFCKKYPNNRTLDPIFSYVLLGNMDYWNDSKLLDNVILNPFREGSFFHFLIDKNASYINLGLAPSNTGPSDSLTFAHMIEDQVNVGYRYVKSFNGLIENKQSTYSFRVRPLFCATPHYKNFSQQFATFFSVGNLVSDYNKICVLNMDTYYHYVRSHMLIDENFLLFEQSIEEINALKNKHGYPFINDE